MELSVELLMNFFQFIKYGFIGLILALCIYEKSFDLWRDFQLKMILVM